MTPEPIEFSFTRQLATIDWAIVAGYVLFSILIGIYFSRRGTRSISDYFASGRGVPWWLLGTSMVATTFAADTPLAISGLVVKQGIWGNWFWWAQIPMFMGGVFFFSRLWRRARILTDTELVDLRYSGKPSKILRGFRALYFALPYNCLVMGWVILSMTKIMGLTFNLPKHWTVMICILITVSYSSISGLWGVVVTDFFQFFLAIGMAIFLAIISVNAIGGFGIILDKLPQIYGTEQAASMTSIIPSIDSPNHGFHIFLLYILLLWWTVGNTDGGSYLAQRMISAKNEKHSFLGYLWFNIAHFCLRPWPWIIVGLVAAVKFPGIATKNPLTGQLATDPELGYIAVMLTYLKPGLLGLMLASFLAAFMSTISTQINWGASYIINDFYRPFIKKDASEKHYVRVSIITVISMAILGGGISFLMKDIFFAWLLLSAINAGIGIVYIARWYWWRINAWSEMSAIASIIGVVAVVLLVRSELTLKIILTAMIIIGLIALFIWGLRKKEWRAQYLRSSVFIILISIIAIALILTITLPEKKFPWTLIYTVPISLAIWLTVTMLTKPVDEDKLIEFYKRVHPGGPGWRAIAAKVGLDEGQGTLFTPRNWRNAILAIIGAFSVLLGFGQFILGRTTTGLALMAIMIVCVVVIVNSLTEEKWEAA
ncbi:Na+:solute symporter [candidate division KSB1 bacterium]|nr:Na+:solute symporter [candidate division KSB1 bacterium]